MTHMSRHVLPWLLSAALLLGCSESLPSRIVPEDTLEIAYVLSNQGTGLAGVHVSISINIENVYDETFIGAVDVIGNIHITWPRRPDVEINLPIRRQQTELLLDPGDAHIVDSFWFLQIDDGRNVMDLLDYSRGDIRYGVQYAEPETFLIDVTMTLFNETGLLTYGPEEFIFEGWKKLDDSTSVIETVRLPPGSQQ